MVVYSLLVFFSMMLSWSKQKLGMHGIWYAVNISRWEFRALSFGSSCVFDVELSDFALSPYVDDHRLLLIQRCAFFHALWLKVHTLLLW